MGWTVAESGVFLGAATHRRGSFSVQAAAAGCLPRDAHPWPLGWLEPTGSLVPGVGVFSPGADPCTHSSGSGAASSPTSCAVWKSPENQEHLFCVSTLKWGNPCSFTTDCISQLSSFLEIAL